MISLLTIIYGEVVMRSLWFAQTYCMAQNCYASGMICLITKCFPGFGRSEVIIIYPHYYIQLYHYSYITIVYHYYINTSPFPASGSASPRRTCRRPRSIEVETPEAWAIFSDFSPKTKETCTWIIHSVGPQSWLNWLKKRHTYYYFLNTIETNCHKPM